MLKRDTDLFYFCCVTAIGFHNVLPRHDTVFKLCGKHVNDKTNNKGAAT